MRTMGKRVHLLGVLLASGAAMGQSGTANKENKTVPMLDLGVMYSAERSNQIGRCDGLLLICAARMEGKEDWLL